MAIVRVSPGVYRNGSGGLARSATGRAPLPRQPVVPPAGQPRQTYNPSRRFNASDPNSVLKKDAQLANPNTVTPTGNTTVTYDRNGNPTYTQTNSPEQQTLLDQQQTASQAANGMAQGALGQAATAMAQPYGYENVGAPAPWQANLPNLPQPQQDPRQGMQALPQWQDPRQGIGAMPDVQGINQQGYNAVWDTYNRRMQPQQQQEQANLEQHLINKGLQPGSDLWNTEFQRLSRQQSDSNLDAQNQAILQGSQMGQQLFNQGLAIRNQGYNENLGAGDQQYNQALTGRQQNFNENLQAGQQLFNQGLLSRQQGYNEAVGNRGQAIDEYNAVRGAPLNEASQLLNIGNVGVRQPNFQPYNPTQTNNAIAVNQFNQTPKGGGGGGGGGGMPAADPYGQIMLQNYLQGMLPGQSGSSGGGPNPYLMGLGAAALQPIVASGSNYIGNYLAQ